MSTISTGAALRALFIANVRYWPTVAPIVHTELRRWRDRADTIPDPTWRHIARTKITTERFNAEVAATLATLAPLPHRADVVRAIVAIEAMYDYLDGASEYAAAHTDGGAHLYDAFSAALGRAELSTADYYADLPADDGGYLLDLGTACCSALKRLPCIDVVAPTAWAAADRCASAQLLTHLIERHGDEELRRWSEPPADRAGLAWWEYAAAGAASILAVHALIAAAADPSCTTADAQQLDRSYLFTCALSTLLDSLMDADLDEATDAHSFIAYYVDGDAMADGLANVTRRAAESTSALKHGPHHLMTVAGVAGYYLSAPAKRTRGAQATAARVADELQPTLQPILALFATWRSIKRLAAITHHGRERLQDRLRVARHLR